MGMYAEASKVNYAPEYSYQKPENGQGATVDGRRSQKTEAEIKREEAKIKKLVSQADRLTAA